MVTKWWARQVFRLRARRLPEGSYAVPFSLYSRNGLRGVEVRARPDGFAYFQPQVHVGGQTFEDSGDEIGPYDTPEIAEHAAVLQGWLNEDET